MITRYVLISSYLIELTTRTQFSNRSQHRNAALIGSVMAMPDQVKRNHFFISYECETKPVNGN